VGYIEFDVDSSVGRAQCMLMNVPCTCMSVDHSSTYNNGLVDPCAVPVINSRQHYNGQLN
jgi:hypothetical protein